MTQLETAAPEETDADAEGEGEGELLPADAKAGDILDAETAAELNENAYMASKPRAYQLPSGEHVLIVPDEPLPQPVVDTLNARVVELKANSHPEALSPSLSAGLRLKEEQESKTGRTIIVVGYNDAGIGEKWGTTAPIGKAFFTEAEAVANAEAFISAAPHRYQIIVLR
ncbi:hypothetical protein NQ166_12345 [Microbacterium sp. zg.Y1090]|uniref:hypothetical protein n=1 Tax=Microbacterium TaxID=33882 RepID=UPI00214BB3BF|nr:MULTISPECIES: hypothetical protein [unclassified Microbacterium]MCR2813876.1 hypothetical protein [Microbacterium sp. zg.Y1084]MCR2819614.1 hypothetical protein [Microbacterium sp. zg.Y1090]MDL5487453.1 hypothetical protein [Microbacterium sp. zg-Y1211]WIM28140.1 hypothetical protein QNO26_13485 [Microbacterium sp. zg-Y1090]